jgi:CubicO group peptidase (beta-lactamase class C family)
MNSRFILFCAFFIVSTTSRADVLKNIEQHVIEFQREKAPGVSYAVTHKGKLIYAGGAGKANLELAVAANNETVFRIASTTKQFTSTAIMMLQEQNKLSIKDNINQYLPDFSSKGNTITIENLLNHTSGIKITPSFISQLDVKDNTAASSDEMLAWLAKEVAFTEPRIEFSYNFVNYNLLGKIIEVTSGVSYKTFIEENIFKKIGMHDSQYDGPQLILNRATGYSLNKNKEYQHAQFVDMTWPYASGAIVSTPTDLGIWHNALINGKLISRDSYKAMTTPLKLKNGQEYPYGFGLFVEKIGMFSTVHHGGNLPGFASDSLYFPEKELYISVMMNGDGYARPLSLSIAAEVLGIASVM